MILKNIYNSYSIPLNLQIHMLRVAGIAKIICDNLASSIEIDSNLLIKALLVHDMGNIVKFDFSIKAIHNDPKEILKLQHIQKRFIKKYGKDAHIATENILKELNIASPIIYITNNMIIENIKQIVKKQQLDLMITTYADSRIAPHGIVSIDERADDLVSRLGRNPTSNWSNPNKVKEFRKSFKECEGYIQNHCHIDLKHVTQSQIETCSSDFLNTKFSL